MTYESANVSFSPNTTFTTTNSFSRIIITSNFYGRIEFGKIRFLANRFFKIVFSVITNHGNIMYVLPPSQPRFFTRDSKFFSNKAAMKIMA